MRRVGIMLGMAASVMSLVAVLGCESSSKKAEQEASARREADARAVAVISPARSATTRPTMNNVRGTVSFAQYGDEVEVTATVEGLPPNSTHGFHIHEKGDLSAPDLMSTGGHWNPGGHPHAGPHDGQAHAGDFGNLKSDANGVARLSLRTRAFSLTKEPNAIGKAVIVHADPDDLKSQPTGNAGARIAGGVIQKQ